MYTIVRVSPSYDSNNKGWPGLCFVHLMIFTTSLLLLPTSSFANAILTPIWELHTLYWYTLASVYINVKCMDGIECWSSSRRAEVPQHGMLDAYVWTVSLSHRTCSKLALHAFLLVFMGTKQRPQPLFIKLSDKLTLLGPITNISVGFNKSSLTSTRQRQASF